MTGIDYTHDPAASSWVPRADQHPDFPVQNLPLGVFSVGSGEPRVGTAIGDRILDLWALSQERVLPEALRTPLQQPTLNALFALGTEPCYTLRHTLFGLLTNPDARVQLQPHLHAAAECAVHLPAAIGDYTDFYVGIHHATNIGTLLRPDNPLLPNYKHVPIGYHGRASSIRPSGIDVRRPLGQRKPPDAAAPTFGPSQRLDYELELGVWIAGQNPLGTPVPIQAAGDRIAGLCLLNDWSARDIQAWEYQPLGPFLAKSFHTTISPWVITREALAPFRIAQPPRPDSDPRPLPYLWNDADQARGAFSLTLEVWLRTQQMRVKGQEAVRISQGAASHMYWTMAQMIAHHTSNGCNLRAGDLLGTGTISGPDRDSAGSLMEISRSGQTPLALPSGETRAFLLDGDEITFTAVANAPGARSIGFGPCTARILPSP